MTGLSYKFIYIFLFLYLNSLAAANNTDNYYIKDINQDKSADYDSRLDQTLFKMLASQARVNAYKIRFQLTTQGKSIDTGAKLPPNLSSHVITRQDPYIRHEIPAADGNSSNRVSIRHRGRIERGFIHNEAVSGMIEGWITDRLRPQAWDPHRLLGIFDDDFNKFAEQVIDAKSTLLSPISIDGHETHPIEIIPNGEDTDSIWRLFLDPSIGWMPRKIEIKVSGSIQKIYENSDFREIEQGVWFPFKLVDREAPYEDTEMTRFTFIVESIKILKESPPPGEFEIHFPHGTLIHDQVTNSTYRAGTVDDFVNKIDELIEISPHVAESEQHLNETISNSMNTKEIPYSSASRQLENSTGVSRVAIRDNDWSKWRWFIIGFTCVAAMAIAFKFKQHLWR